MAGELRLSLTRPQAEFVIAEDQFPAIVAGFGSGKTESLVARCLVRKLSYPAGWIGYYAPTFDLINLISIPRFEEMLEAHGLAYQLHKTEMVLRIRRLGAIVFRTMDRPERIIGYETADAGIDELDTLKPDHAQRAWNRIIARNREKKPHGQINSVAVATTPEGFRFVYDRWVRKAAAGYRLIRASTYSNAHNLPEGYIPSLEASYPPQLLAAYLRGEFVNLTEGAVYPDFDRDLNRTAETIRPNEPLHIGMDFNIYRMAAVVFVIRDGKPYALEELVNLRDTPQMVQAITDRYKRAGRSITIYPDSSGKTGSTTNVSLSDMTLLTHAGFALNYPPGNPPVKDRVMSVNAAICTGTGQRSLRVNTEQCPQFTEALEQQVYDKNGEPEKKGHDHVNDAGGYFIHRKFPVVRSTAQQVRISGI